MLKRRSSTTNSKIITVAFVLLSLRADAQLVRVQDAEGMDIVLFDEDGNIWIEWARLVTGENANLVPDPNVPEFVIKNASGEVLMRVGDDDACLNVKGGVEVEQASIGPSSLSTFMVKNAAGDVVIALDSVGNLRTKGKIYQGGNEVRGLPGSSSPPPLPDSVNPFNTVTVHVTKSPYTPNELTVTPSGVPYGDGGYAITCFEGTQITASIEPLVNDFEFVGWSDGDPSETVTFPAANYTGRIAIVRAPSFARIRWYHTQGDDVTVSPMDGATMTGPTDVGTTRSIYLKGPYDFRANLDFSPGSNTQFFRWYVSEHVMAWEDNVTVSITGGTLFDPLVIWAHSAPAQNPPGQTTPMNVSVTGGIGMVLASGAHAPPYEGGASGTLFVSDGSVPTPNNAQIDARPAPGWSIGSITPPFATNDETLYTVISGQPLNISVNFSKDFKLDAGYKGSGRVNFDNGYKWSYRDRTNPLLWPGLPGALDGPIRVPLTAQPYPNAVFIRWEGDLPPTADPANPSIQIVMDSDKHISAVFSPRRPYVVGLSGEQFFPSTYKNSGVYTWTQSLDSNLYEPVCRDEDGVRGSIPFFSRGSGRVYNEIKALLELGAIDTIVLVGHSHGGGAVYSLSQYLQATIHNLPPFELRMTGYVDAIDNAESSSLICEARKPPLVALEHHVNAFQQIDSPLRGCWTNPATSNNFILNVALPACTSGVRHGTIDDCAVVHHILSDNLNLFCYNVPLPFGAAYCDHGDVCIYN